MAINWFDTLKISDGRIIIALLGWIQISGIH